MNPKTKKYLIISAKHAVNALLTNGGLWALFPKTFNFHDWTGMLAFLKATAVIILTREVMVWGPKIVKWSSTDVSLDDSEPTKADSAAAGR
jgi:hypothetical protein